MDWTTLHTGHTLAGRAGLPNTLRAEVGAVGTTDVDDTGWEGERRDESDDGGGAEVVRDGLPVTGRLDGIRATPRRATADSDGAATDGCDKLTSSGFETRPVSLPRTSARKGVTLPAAAGWRRCCIRLE